VAFIRFAVMTPKQGEEERLKALIEELIAYHRTRDGFVAEYLLEPDEHDLHGFIGRFAAWESEDAANATAQDQHDIVLQSQIKRAAQEAGHEERAFQAEIFAPE
jgi:hypothetical protein